MNYPNLTLENTQSNTINILLPGKSGGKQNSLMQSIFNQSVENNISAISFDYPFFTNNSNVSSGNELIEEQKALEKVIKLTDSLHKTNINFIAKSLGGAVLLSFLSNNLLNIEFNIYILGFVVDKIIIQSIKNPITINIWHGSKDEYMSEELVTKTLDQNKLIKYNLHSIIGANHSFNSPDTKDSKFHQKIIFDLFNQLTK